MVFWLAGKLYKTKKDVKELMRYILHKYKIGEYLKEEDAKVIMDLLKYHPRYEHKKGNGIKAIFVGEGKHKNKCFYIERIDGTKTDFSYLKCIYGEKFINLLKQACRNAIWPYILEFKRKIFENNEKVICPLTGRQLSWEDAHIDHENPPFEEIFQRWYVSYGYRAKKEDLIFDEDGLRGVKFRNKALKNSFVKFHNKLAKLRIISKEANLKLQKRNFSLQCKL